MILLIIFRISLILIIFLFVLDEFTWKNIIKDQKEIAKDYLEYQIFRDELIKVENKNVLTNKGINDIHSRIKKNKEKLEGLNNANL